MLFCSKKIIQELTNQKSAFFYSFVLFFRIQLRRYSSVVSSTMNMRKAWQVSKRDIIMHDCAVE